ncbi:MAG: DinB family protein [Chloroflexota bacterium]|nr:DinB family protein [Chloroflexota bacterium]
MSAPSSPRPLRDPLVEHRPGPLVPLAPSVARARASIEATLRDMLAVPDGKLEGPWRWRPNDQLDADIRYGLYRVHEILEEGVARIARGRSGMSAERTGPAVPRLAAVTTARWELHGAVVGLRPEDLDADPGGGEWSVRQTLGHIVGVQRSYGWYSAWYLSRAGRPDAGQLPPDGTMPGEPDEMAEGQGTLGAVRTRLDGLVDAATERFALLDAAALAVPARWSSLPVTIDFRLGRLASHIREHTIQVDKTLVMVGRTATEAERLARLAGSAYGRLEGTVFGRPAKDVEREFADGQSAASILEATAAEAATTASRVRKAATSG